MFASKRNHSCGNAREKNWANKLPKRKLSLVLGTRNAQKVPFGWFDFSYKTDLIKMFC